MRLGVPRIGFIDANTQFGTEFVEVIGDAAAGKTSDHAVAVAVAIGLKGMSVQSTFDGLAAPDAT